MIEVSCFRQHSVKGGASVALRENEAIAVSPVWIARIVPQHPEIKGDQQFDLGKRPAWMTAARRSDHLDDLNPQAIGQPFHLSNGVDSRDRGEIGSGAHGGELFSSCLGLAGAKL